MKKILMASLIGLSFLTTTQGYGQTTVTKVQSLYIYNFVKNIQWPSVSDKYVIGVYGTDATVSGFKATLAGRNFNGKSFEIKKISSPSQASDCHVVFVGSESVGLLKKISEGANLNNTLIVSEKVSSNAGISFVEQNSKLKFKINEAKCKASGLQVSNDLMALSV